MIWFKMFSEARNDAKLRTLSDGEFRTWFNLICLASEQSDRGIIEDYDEELLAIEVCNADKALLGVTLVTLQKLRIISVTGENQISFLKFEDRQSLKPSDSAKRVAERVKKHRESKRAKAPKETPPDNDNNIKECNAGVTPCNATETPIDKIREEKSTEEERRNNNNVPREREEKQPSMMNEINVNDGLINLTPEQRKKLNEVLITLEKTTQWEMGTVSESHRRAIGKIVLKMDAENRTFDDLELYKKGFLDFIVSRGQKPHPPTPDQMLSNFDTILAIQKEGNHGINSSNNQPKRGLGAVSEFAPGLTTRSQRAAAAAGKAGEN